MLVCSTAQRNALKLTLYRAVYNRGPFAKLMIIIAREEKGSFIEIDLFCESVGIAVASTSTLVYTFLMISFITQNMPIF